MTMHTVAYFFPGHSVDNQSNQLQEKKHIEWKSAKRDANTSRWL